MSPSMQPVPMAAEAPAGPGTTCPAGGRVVITGGAGYVGYRLGLHIAANCPEYGPVVLFDMREPHGKLPAGVTAAVGDICDPRDVALALQGASVVFHVASYGMSGEECCYPDRIHKVNVLGTQNIIHTCQQLGVPRLVYISTYNAVFDSWNPIEAGTEASTTYVTNANGNTHYSYTKAQAEQAVLAANGTPLGSGDGVLHTCALRPAGIWGPGEQRSMPRVVRMARRGALVFLFGAPDALVDFLHVDNLIQAMLLADKALTSQKQHVAAGKAYFISDDYPINNFDHLGRIIQGLGYSWPRMWIPFWLVYYLAALLEILCAVATGMTGRMMVPFISRMEVAKCAINHWAKCDLAKKELGYAPVKPEALYDDVITWYKVRHYGPQIASPEVAALRAVRVIRVVMALMVVAFLFWSMHRNPSADHLTSKLDLTAVSLSSSLVEAEL